MGKYNVAFRYTRKTGGYHGVVTWTSFDDKESFDKWYTDDIRERQAVVEEGVSDERCMELTHDTPFACRVAAAVEESISLPRELYKEMLGAQIAMAIFADQQAQKTER